MIGKNAKGAHCVVPSGQANDDLERVRLRQDLPKHGLARGESGTVVHVFETADAYSVEFVNPVDGSTRALAEFTPNQRAPADA